MVSGGERMLSIFAQGCLTRLPGRWRVTLFMADERVAGKPAGSSECYRLTPRGVWPPGVLEVERGEPPREKRRELATMTRDREEFVAILSRELSNEPTHKVVDLARKLCRLCGRPCRL